MTLALLESIGTKGSDVLVKELKIFSGGSLALGDGSGGGCHGGCWRVVIALVRNRRVTAEGLSNKGRLKSEMRRGGENSIKERWRRMEVFATAVVKTDH